MFRVFHFVRILHVIFKLLTEVPDCASHRPRGRISQRTNCVSLNLFGNTYQQINVFHVSVTMFDPVQNFFHPSRPLAAWTALTAGLMMIKSRERPEVAHNARSFIHHDKSSGTQHGTADKSTIGH